MPRKTRVAGLVERRVSAAPDAPLFARRRVLQVAGSLLALQCLPDMAQAAVVAAVHDLNLAARFTDRVAVLAHNCIEWMEIYAALARAGLVAVPLNFRLTAPEMAYIAEHSEARAFIVQDALAEVVEPLRQSLGLEPNAWIGFGSEVPAGWMRYEQLIETAPTDLPPVQVLPADMSALMYTSGTTGRPKGAVRSHEGSTLIALATALEMGFTHQDTALLVMPMCHANSLYFSHTFVHLGATCVIDDRRSFDPEALLATLSQEKVTFTSLVPTHYIMLLSLPEETKKKLSEANKGKIPKNKGIKHTEEEKQKIKDALAKLPPLICPHCNHNYYITEEDLAFNPNNDEIHIVFCQKCGKEYEVYYET